jgi:Flp pilus assembly protein TadD
LLLRSASLRENGDLDAAEACLKILLQQTVAPAEFSLVKQELALVYQVAGRTEEAEQLLAEAGISTFSKSDLDLNLDFTDDDIDDFDLK